MDPNNIRDHITHNIQILMERGVKDIRQDVPNLLYGNDKIGRRELEIMVAIDTVPNVTIEQLSRLFYVTPDRMRHLLIRLNTKLTTANSRYIRSKDILQETDVIDKLIKYLRVFDHIYISDFVTRSGDTINKVIRRHQKAGNKDLVTITKKSIEIMHMIQFGDLLTIEDVAKYLSITVKTAETRVERLNTKVEDLIMIFVKDVIYGTPLEIYVKPTKLDDKSMSFEEIIESLHIFTTFESNYFTLPILSNPNNFIKK